MQNFQRGKQLFDQSQKRENFCTEVESGSVFAFDQVNVMFGPTTRVSEVGNDFSHLGFVPEESFSLGVGYQLCFFGNEVGEVCAFGVGPN